MDNAKLGRETLDVIESHPKNFSMLTWGMGNHNPGDPWVPPPPPAEEPNHCGTVACIAGHVMLLSGYSLRSNSFYRPDGEFVGNECEDARILLGMSADESKVFAATIHGDDYSLARFRVMVEEAEKREANEGTVLS